jgi:hypothetical protein
LADLKERNQLGHEETCGKIIILKLILRNTVKE